MRKEVNEAELVDNFLKVIEGIQDWVDNHPEPDKPVLHILEDKSGD